MLAHAYFASLMSAPIRTASMTIGFFLNLGIDFSLLLWNGRQVWHRIPKMEIGTPCRGCWLYKCCCVIHSLPTLWKNVRLYICPLQGLSRHLYRLGQNLYWRLLPYGISRHIYKGLGQHNWLRLYLPCRGCYNRLHSQGIIDLPSQIQHGLYDCLKGFPILTKVH